MRSKKKSLLILILFTLLCGCTLPKQKTEIAQHKTDKNVLFIVVDDLNTTLGCYDHPVVKTPNIDKLAERGVKFNHAYCNYAVCGPSRSSFLSGLRPESINVLNNRTPLQDVLGDRITMPHLFKQNGFYTASLGKVFHRNERGYGDPKAWDEIYTFETSDLGNKGETRNMTDGVLKWCHWKIAEGEDEDQQDGQIAKKAVELIKTKRDKPFFLAVGLHKPHDPFIAPKKYFEIYPLEDCDPPVLPEGWKPPFKHTLPGETKTFNKFTDQDKREFLRSYYACTSFMDAQVGKLIKALEESGQLDNTLIVLFGDHGYHLGEHNWWNKVTLFEKGTNAPFIMAGNAVHKNGEASNAMFEYIDIYPTLAGLFQLENTPDYLEGKSFAKILDDPSLDFRSEVRAVVRRGEMLGRMVKNKDYRFVEWDESKEGYELYDQRIDPVEYNNLADKQEYKTIVDEMRQLLYEK